MIASLAFSVRIRFRGPLSGWAGSGISRGMGRRTLCTMGRTEQSENCIEITDTKSPYLSTTDYGCVGWPTSQRHSKSKRGSRAPTYNGDLTFSRVRSGPAAHYE